MYIHLETLRCAYTSRNWGVRTLETLGCTYTSRPGVYVPSSAAASVCSEFLRCTYTSLKGLSAAGSAVYVHLSSGTSPLQDLRCTYAGFELYVHQI